jgi:hypothetical protein
MILDAQNLFSNDQSITTATTQNSTNVIDNSVAAVIGVADLNCVVRLRVNAATGAASLRAQLVGSDSSALTSPVILADTGVITTPAAGSNALFHMKVPASAQTSFTKPKKRFYGIIYISTLTTSIDFSVTAGFVVDDQLTAMS